MSYSVNDLQTLIANELDRSASPPTDGGTDWTVRLSALNRAQLDWLEFYDWESLKKVFNGNISTSINNASYSLPADFRKLDGYVLVNDGTTTYNVGQIDPSRNRQYTSSNYFANILGNNADNKTLYLSVGTLPSGASIQFTYYSTPTSLVTTSQVTACPDPTFILQRALYYLYKQREDARFPEAKTEAEKIMARMLEGENTLGLSHADRRVPVAGGNFFNWRVGDNG